MKLQFHVVSPYLAGLLLAFAAVSCASSNALPDRDPALAHRLVEQDGALLLDVRTPQEYDEGHIDGASNIPVQQLASRLAEVQAMTGDDKNQPIVLYCGSGRRADQAKQLLLEDGYTQVTNLGGFKDW